MGAVDQFLKAGVYFEEGVAKAKLEFLAALKEVEGSKDPLDNTVEEKADISSAEKLLAEINEVKDAQKILEGELKEAEEKLSSLKDTAERAESTLTTKSQDYAEKAEWPEYFDGLVRQAAKELKEAAEAEYKDAQKDLQSAEQLVDDLKAEIQINDEKMSENQAKLDLKMENADADNQGAEPVTADSGESIAAIVKTDEVDSKVDLKTVVKQSLFADETAPEVFGHHDAEWSGAMYAPMAMPDALADQAPLMVQ
jgi:chromosome segregation ATPase